MKSSRVSIILCYDKRTEVEKGVFEKQVVEKKVKAEKEKIYQRRLDKALADGQVLTARFRIRSNYVTDSLMTGNSTTMSWIDEELTNILYQLKAIYGV